MSMNAELFAAYVRYIKQKIEPDSAQEICMGTINRLKNADELFFETEDGVE